MEDYLGINLEIAVSDMVAQAHYLPPWNLGTLLQKFAFGVFVDILDTLADSLQLHTRRRQNLHSARPVQVIIDIADVGIPLLNQQNGRLYLMKYRERKAFGIRIHKHCCG